MVSRGFCVTKWVRRETEERKRERERREKRNRGGEGR